MTKIKIGNKECELPYSIKKKIDDYGYSAVLLEVPPEVIYNENFFLFDLKSGNQLWQIDKSIVNQHKLGVDEPFINVDFTQEGKIVLSSWGGWKVTLDPITGKELSYEFTK